MRSCDHGSSQTSLTSTSATPSTAATASATVRGIAPAGCCYVGAGVPLVNRLATLLSDDLVALLLQVTMWISTWTGRRCRHPCGAAASAAASAGMRRDGRSAFQSQIPVSRLPITCGRQLGAVEEAHPAQIGAVDVGAIEHSLEEVGCGELGADEHAAAQHRSTKIGPVEVRSGKVRAPQVETPQAGTGRVGRHLRVLGASGSIPERSG